MLASLFDTLAGLGAVEALQDRATLFLNHLLLDEPQAPARLQSLAGRRVRLAVEGLPLPGPGLPPLRWAITPAGLLERLPPEGEAELSMRLSLPPPGEALGRALRGERPDVQIEGEAQLAAEAAWLVQHLRLDPAAELERWFGPIPAQALADVGSRLREGLRAWAERLQGGPAR